MPDHATNATHNKRPTGKRRWIWRLLFVAFIWLVVTRFAEIETLVLTALNGRAEWLLLAVLFQFTYYSLYSNVFRLAMEMLGVRIPWRVMLPSTFATMFVNVVAPLGGASGVAVFVDQAIKRKQSPTRTAAGALLAIISDFSAFSLILVTGLAYLFINKDLKVYELVAAVLLLALTVGMTSILLLGLWQPALLRRLLDWVHRLVNGLFARMKRVSPLGLEWVDRTFEDFVGIGKAIHSNPKGLGRLFLMSFAAYSMDLISLWMIFRAFGQSVHFGVLVAGFSMGILFWVITITPQGIGLVEGMMALVYTSLGVDANLATVIALTFRGLTFWIPFFLGFIFLQVLPMFRGESRTEVRDWSVRIAALLTALAGILNMISAVVPPIPGRVLLLEKMVPVETYFGFYIITALAGFGLLMLADGLWHRKQAAWRLTLVFLALSAVSNLLKGLAFEEALLAVALGFWLVLLRPNFHAHSVYPPLQQGVRTLLAAMGYICLYGIAGFYLLDGHFAVNYGLLDATEQIVRMFTDFRASGVAPSTPFGAYFASSIYLVTGFVLVFILIMLVRPLIIRAPATPRQRERARKIIEKHAKSGVDAYALLDDKLYFFSKGGSVLAYTVKGRVALVFGEPVGPAGDYARALNSFLERCRKKGWMPAFFQVRPAHLETYEKVGLESIRIGDELHLDLARLDLDGPSSGSVFETYRHMASSGFKAEYHAPPQSAAMIDDLQVISDEWLTFEHVTERRFSLGWFDNEFVKNSGVVAAYDPKDRIVGFASLLASRAGSEVYIDLLRYFQDAGAGMRDYLLAASIRWAAENGYQQFNFGFLPAAAETPSQEDDGRMQYAAKHLKAVFSARRLLSQVEGLVVVSSPRFIVLPPGGARKASLAILRSDSWDEFIEDYVKDAWRRAWATRGLK